MDICPASKMGNLPASKEMEEIMKLGTRCLPKYLVEKLGADVIKAAVNRKEPEFLEGNVISRMKSRDDYHAKSYANSDAKMKAKKKWQGIRDGEIPPDTLYSVDDALSMAGL